MWILKFLKRKNKKEKLTFQFYPKPFPIDEMYPVPPLVTRRIGILGEKETKESKQLHKEYEYRADEWSEARKKK